MTRLPVTCSLMRCLVSMGSILSLSPGHPGDPCQIGPGDHAFKPRGLQEVADGAVLADAVLQVEPSRRSEMGGRLAGDLPDGVQAVGAADEGGCRLETERRKVRIAGRHVW